MSMGDKSDDAADNKRRGNVVLNNNRDDDCDWLVDEELLDGLDNDGDGQVDEDTAANPLYPPLDIQYNHAAESQRVLSVSLVIVYVHCYPLLYPPRCFCCCYPA